MKSNGEAAELRKHLFDQLDRLADPKNDLDKELKRAEALSKVATVIVNSHKQEVDMVKAAAFGNRQGIKNMNGKKEIGNGK